MMTGPLEVLARIRENRPVAPAAGERCEMCAEPVPDEHRHVVNIEGRQLLCVCVGCYLLFTDTRADLRYRAVPDRYLTFPEFAVTRRDWEALQIPVGLAYFFHNSALGRIVAFYPGPGGACESELDLTAWDVVRAADPRVDLLRPDVEALMFRVPEAEPLQCRLIPIDTCFGFVGRLRQLWRGFDGGQDVRGHIEEFFTTLELRAQAVDR